MKEYERILINIITVRIIMKEYECNYCKNNYEGI